MAESEKPTEASPAEKEQPDSTPAAASSEAEDKPVAPEKPVGEDKAVGEDKSGEDKSTEDKSKDKSSEDKSTEDKSTQSSETKSTEDKPAADSVKADPTKLEQHHVSKILDDVLEESDLAASAPSFKHPLLLDVALTVGLLLAVGGFMLGIMNMWIAHQAKENIMHRNYKAAITMLKGVPFSGWFNIAGSDPAELLSQALYQEAMEKLDADDQDQSAVEELGKIPPGSAFFDNAQEIVKEHSTAAVQLQGKAEHEASPSEAVAQPKPLLPPSEEGKDASP